MRYFIRLRAQKSYMIPKPASPVHYFLSLIAKYCIQAFINIYYSRTLSKTLDVFSIVLSAICGCLFISIILFFANGTDLIPFVLKLGDNPIIVIFAIIAILAGAGVCLVLGQYLRGRTTKKE